MHFNHTTVPWLISKSTLLVVILGLLASWVQAPSSTDSLHYVSNSCLKTAVNATFIEGSSFQANLNQTLLSQFPDKASKFGFSNFTTGVGIDQLYALYYCKGDVDHKTCHDCVQAAAVKVIDVCKFKKEAIIWYEECTLRYANRPIFSIDEKLPYYLYANNSVFLTAYHLDQYQRIFDSLMTSVIEQAANSSGAMPGFATKEVNLSSIETLRGLAQCTPDIAGPRCYRCLKAALMQKDSWANTIIFLPSCIVRYDLFGSTPPSDYILPIPPADISPVPGAIFVIVSIVLLSIIIFLLVVRFRHHCWSGHGVDVRVVSTIKTFTFWEVICMTCCFKNKRGEGSFGIVYRGKFGGTYVAVKVIKPKVVVATAQFKTEMEVSGNVSHENVVSMIGYCKSGIRLCLVYEYMNGKDLKILLSDKENKLRWKERLSIVIDVAKGLQYLNDSRGCIVHRDVKPSNILLSRTTLVNGDCRQAKIADFGICRIYPTENISTYYSNNDVAGTRLYMDPQYMINNRMSTTIDGYSLGIVLLELITGETPRSDGGVDLIDKAKRNVEQNLVGILDPKVKQDVGQNYKSVLIAMKLAFRCVQASTKARPTMHEIVEELMKCMALATNIDVASSSGMA